MHVGVRRLCDNIVANRSTGHAAHRRLGFANVHPNLRVLAPCFHMFAGRFRIGSLPCMQGRDRVGSLFSFTASSNTPTQPPLRP